MAKNKGSGQGKLAKSKGKAKDEGQGEKRDAGGKGGKQENARDPQRDDSKDEIRVRHILCEKHSDKEKALERLKAGEDFHTVACDVTEHKKSSGGLLDNWHKKNSLKFGDVAFTLEVSSVTNPKIAECKTDQGYHIIMVEGRRRAKG